MSSHISFEATGPSGMGGTSTARSSFRLCPIFTMTGSHGGKHKSDAGSVREGHDCSPAACAALLRSAFAAGVAGMLRSEEHTSELQSHVNLVCRLLLEKKKKKTIPHLIQKKKKTYKVTT